MNFISISFIAFLLLTTFVFYVLPKKLQWRWLLAISIYFYLCFDIRFIAFLGGSALIAYVGAIVLSRLKTKQTIYKKIILSLIIGLNIGILIFIKYCNYLIGVTNVIANRLGWSLSFYGIDILVPIGISFYTLQIVGYCIDVYREKTLPQMNFFKFFLFTSFFPQILQGPIARYENLSPQFFREKSFDYKLYKFGWQLILWGFFKKMVIADRAAIFVNEVFGNISKYEGITLLSAAILYSVQIYADFSGCVDIARGVAELFQIHLVHNFERPYAATSISDFWRRWHISLSTWLRDYVYIPLGGNRKGSVRKAVNILIVFTVSGLWHGAGIHYIFWGLSHGLYQVIGMIKNRLIKVESRKDCKYIQVFQRGVTFGLVTLSWIFFRADTLRDAFLFVKRMLFFNPWVLWDSSLYQLGIDRRTFCILIISMIIWGVVSHLQKNLSIREWINQKNIVFRWTIYLVGIFAILIFGVYGVGYNASDFIYGAF